MITSDGSQKAINAERSGVGVLSQVDGARWLSLEGRAGVNRDPAAVRDAELRYAQRYRTPRENPKRVVIEVHVTRVLGLGPARPHQALSQPAETTIRSCGRSLTASAPSAVTITMSSMRAPQRPGK